MEACRLNIRQFGCTCLMQWCTMPKQSSSFRRSFRSSQPPSEIRSPGLAWPGAKDLCALLLSVQFRARKVITDHRPLRSPRWQLCPRDFAGSVWPLLPRSRYPGSKVTRPRAAFQKTATTSVCVADGSSASIRLYSLYSDPCQGTSWKGGWPSRRAARERPGVPYTPQASSVAGCVKPRCQSPGNWQDLLKHERRSST